MNVRTVGLSLLLGLILFVSSGTEGPGGVGVGVDVALGDTWQCVEYNSDYSLGCGSGVGVCGSHCFYAVCEECTRATHQHCWACGEFTCCTTHTHGISPCVDWNWELDIEADNYREHEYDDQTFLSPNVEDALNFGLWDPEYILPPIECLDGTDLSGGLVASLVREDLVVVGSYTLSGSDGDVWGSFYVDTGWPVVIDGQLVTQSPGIAPDMVLIHRGPQGLVELPGDPGAPVLGSIEKVDDDTVKVVVVGDRAGVQFRYWVYSGDEPSEFQVPFGRLPLPSEEVDIDGSYGIHSFQLMKEEIVDGELVHLWSNVVHQMVGYEKVHAEYGGTRADPNDIEAMDPLPEPFEGVRPDKPVLTKLEQLAGTGVVEVTVEPYVGRMEYRWWPHSGFWPQFEDIGWSPVPAGQTVFVVNGVFLDWPLGTLTIDAGDFVGLSDPDEVARLQGWLPGVDIGDVPMAMYFAFQVQVIGPPDGLASDPSDAMSLLVWRGNLWEW